MREVIFECSLKMLNKSSVILYFHVIIVSLNYLSILNKNENEKAFDNIMKAI